jgi:membrane protein DedA with SNARE-associated domain
VALLVFLPDVLAAFDRFEEWVSSDWSYLVIFAVALIDAFFPLVPSETVVITGGVLAGAGDLSLPLVILCASSGAIAGDNVSYGLGHFLGERTVKRVFKGEKSHAAFTWAEHQLDQRGTYLIVVARFIPGGRTATTFSAGYVRTFPYRRFIAADVLAGLIWGTYAACLGYFGGKTFEEQPWKGLIVAFVVAIAIAGAVELVRYRRERRRHRAAGERDDAGVERTQALSGRPAAPPRSEDVPSSE